MSPKSDIKTCHFGIQHYREILETGLENGYGFIGFDGLGGLAKAARALILRHDVDYLPERCLRFGEIERDLGVRSTFFFQVGAKPYNLRAAENRGVARALAGMGHTVGVHVDVGWKSDLQGEEIPAFCAAEKKLFTEITGIEPCAVISFHNPHRFMELILNRDIPGMRHTYEKAFFSGIKYVSDSQGWYEGCLCRILAARRYDVIQFLSHAYIWPEKSTGDFVSDMARLVHFRGRELAEYMIEFHPTCRQHADRLRREVAKLFAEGPSEK